MKLNTKLIISVILISLAVIAHCRWLDNASLEHTQEGLQRALVTYGVSRGLNGVVSVVQGTEIAIEPVGVGMTFTPGQILDPVNDLIERFSGIVLVSGTAFGIQRVLLDVVASPFFSILVGLVIGLLLLSLWLTSKKNLTSYFYSTYKLLLLRSAIIILIIRFSIPITAILSETVYEHFLEPNYIASSQELMVATRKLEKIKTETETAKSSSSEPKSLLESAKAIYNSATNKLDMQQHINDFKLAAENISEHAIQLIVVFVIQTLLLPLLSVWVTLKTIKWVAFKRFAFLN